jgi:ATP-dependent Lhr-like helicase
VNGVFVLESPLGDALRSAGFTATPQGVRLRA